MVDIGVDINLDTDLEMAVSINWGLFVGVDVYEWRVLFGLVCNLPAGLGLVYEVGLGGTWLLRKLGGPLD